MFIHQRISLPILVLFVILSHQAFALGEAISELADEIGDNVGIGVTATEIDRDNGWYGNSGLKDHQNYSKKIGSA